MSIQSPPIPDDTDFSPKAQRLATYLRDEVRNEDGDLYIKGKFISDDVDLSPKEIGALMVQLQGDIQGVEIEKWANTSATTWRITEQETGSIGERSEVTAD